MTIRLTYHPFNPSLVDGFTDEEAKSICSTFASPLVKQFCEKQVEYLRGVIVTIDPLGMTPEDYHDTCVHVRGLASLWDGLVSFSEQSKAALIADALQSQQQ